MRNPFPEVICNRGNFTRKMKNPFEFAKELLRYSRGELSEVEKESVEEMLSKVKGLDELAEELKDKKRVENELRVVESFDVEKALVRLRKTIWKETFAFVLGGGSVGCGSGGYFCVFIVGAGG